jgi:hypothetical protein
MTVADGNVTAVRNVSAALLSTTGTANTSGESSASTAGAIANAAPTAATKTTESADKMVAAQVSTLGENEERGKRLPTKAPALQRRVGRVTVILPKT